MLNRLGIQTFANWSFGAEGQVERWGMIYLMRLGDFAVRVSKRPPIPELFLH